MATLINVATPGPALQTSVIDSTVLGIHGLSVVFTSAGTPYELAELALTAGLWVVTGVAGFNYGVVYAPALYLNTASAVASNSWPVQINSSYNSYISAVIKLSGTATIYLNGTTPVTTSTYYGFLTATQIG
jgi:hypothetical protein